MPEVPDLEAVCAVLNRHLPGVAIEAVEAPCPIVLRVPVADLQARLIGATFGLVERRGKFLIFELSTGDRLVVNAMLTGRWHHVPPDAPRPPRLCLSFTLSSGRELRYSDERVMGKIYLVAADALGTIPQFAEMGPDALDPALTEALFLDRLRRYSGQIKNVLVNHQFVAGIGNTYADEILFVAGIHPFTKCRDLDDARRRRLYAAVHTVMNWAIPLVREAMGEQVGEKPRDFLRVHRRGGQPCLVCGAPISEVSPNQRVTSFCRRCQPS